MKKLITLLCFLLTSVSLFFACSKEESPKPDYQKLLTPEQISFTPEILTIKGQLIPLDFKAEIPARFLPRKALLTLTPILVCVNNDDKEYLGTAKTWQGDRVIGENEVIAYDTPTTVTWQEIFTYKEAMKDKYELYLQVSIIDGPLTSFRFLIGTGEFQKSSL